MSMMFVCEVSVDANAIDNRFLDPVIMFARQADMFVFCPPIYMEPFLKNKSSNNYLIFDLADNAEFDNCDMIFYIQSEHSYIGHITPDN